MEYKDFVRNLADDLQEKFDEQNKGITVTFTEVKKAWGMEIGVMCSKGGNMSPVLYPHKAYEYFEKGMAYPELLEKMVEEAENALENAPKNFKIDLEYLNENISMQLVNTQKSREYLRNIPHKEIEDLSIIYRVIKEIEQDYSSGVVVTNQLLKYLGLSKDELHKIALEKAPVNMKFQINGLSELLGIENSDETIDIPYNPMMCISNEKMLYGASAIFYPEALERCASAMNGDFFIIPSSVHEVLIYPDDSRISVESLKSIVMEINSQYLDPKEFLSNNVYHYDSKEKVFELTEKYINRSEKRKLSVIDSLNEKKMESFNENLYKNRQDAGNRKEQGISL